MVTKPEAYSHDKGSSHLECDLSKFPHKRVDDFQRIL